MPLLAEHLDGLYRAYGAETIATDPILFVGRYADDEDREVAGWIASAFAYGQVPVIQANVGRLLGVLGPRPARFLDGVRDFRALARGPLRTFRHRFHGGADAAALLYAISRAREAGVGTLRGFFESGRSEADRDVGGLLTRAVAFLTRLDYRPALGVRLLPERSPVRFFFPDPASGSACKRWNLYLRWMVRHDALDFGIWRGVPTEHLVVPTDTHVHRIARRLGLTRRRTADWKTAREITDGLARFDAKDPVRFDYALCRIGILDICAPEPRRCRCEACPVQAACGLGRRRLRRRGREFPAPVPRLSASA